MTLRYNFIPTLLTLLAVLCAGTEVKAGNQLIEPVVINESGQVQVSGKSMMIFRDPTRKLSYLNIIRTDTIQVLGDVPKLGISKDDVWMIFDLTNNSSEETFYLEYALPVLHRIDFFDSISFGKYHSESKGVTRMEDGKERDPFFSFQFNLKPNETRRFALKVYTGEELLAPIYIKKISLKRSTRYKSRFIFYGLFTGLMIAMFLYNFVILLYTRNILYLYYIIYVLSVALAQLSIQGVYQNYFNVFGHWFNPYALPVSSALVGIMSPLFAYKFLKMNRTLPKLQYIIHSIVVFYTLTLAVVFTGNFQFTYNLLLIGGSLGAIALFVLPLIIIFRVKDNRHAKFYLVSWSTFLIGVTVYSLRDFGVLPYNDLTNYTMPIGAALETILLSLALADQINSLKKEKEETQTQMFLEMRKNRDLIKNQNILLEKKVNERTEKLAEANQNLQQTLNDLKSTQSQLVDAEKMASLGQLTAGIAHEINNPINFVSSNIEPLRADIRDIVDMLEKYKELAKDDDKFESVREAELALDLKYSIEEIESLLSGIEEGARRTSQIVNSLKTFSRMDEDTLKESDINDGLISTLTILRSEIGAIRLQTDYGKLPLIECYPGKLNQVFMNLLDNAIFAVKEMHGNSDKGIISVKTEQINDLVHITIADNGKGMDEKDLNRIFEPFFTTKEVGKGTGLGLSISYSIIENHNGTIQTTSKPDKGTKFTISIPVKHKTDNH